MVFYVEIWALIRAPLYLTALVRCICCLKSTLLGSTVDSVHSVSCTVSVLSEEYTYFYGSTVDTVLASVFGGFGKNTQIFP